MSKSMQGMAANLTELLHEAGDAALFVTDAAGRVIGTSHAFSRLAGLGPEALLECVVESAGSVSGALPAGEFIAAVFSAGIARKGRIALPGFAQSCGITFQPLVADDRIDACAVMLQIPGHPGTPSRQGFDALTGLPNRDLFVDRVEQAVHAVQRTGKSLAIILTAFDRFNEINDVLGDQAGQQILQEVAARLRQCVRTSDTVARLEGDRFAFVMQIASTDDSVLLIDKILLAFEQPLTLNNGQDAVIDCTLGVSIYPTDGRTPDELLQKSTVALHHAKQGGRNRYQYFSDDMNARAQHRLNVESQIRRALGNDEFLVYYQPKIDINQRRVAGLEALVRWRDPLRGMISPSEFIPIAEESGLIEQIGQWVMEETCLQSRRWQDAGLPSVRASVNVSARQFRNRNFVAQVEEVLSRTGLDPCWLELEITESMLMGDIGAIVTRMEDLRRIGVSLSIDDFGTGYSSLSYLSRFPITTLKIDRAFIADVQTNPHTAEIARAIIGLSRGLNLEVVAEGAEVAEQIEFLRTHGCELVQGFFYSKPLPADDFAALLATGL